MSGVHGSEDKNFYSGDLTRAEMFYIDSLLAAETNFHAAIAIPLPDDNDSPEVQAERHAEFSKIKCRTPDGVLTRNELDEFVTRGKKCEHDQNNDECREFYKRAVIFRGMTKNGKTRNFAYWQTFADLKEEKIHIVKGVKLFQVIGADIYGGNTNGVTTVHELSKYRLKIGTSKTCYRCGPGPAFDEKNPEVKALDSALMSLDKATAEFVKRDSQKLREQEKIPEIHSRDEKGAMH